MYSSFIINFKQFFTIVDMKCMLSLNVYTLRFIQCDQTGQNPAHLGGFQHFWAGKFFDGAVGGLGGLLHKMRKWRNFFTKTARIFGWGGQFGRNLDLYGRFRWKTSGHTEQNTKAAA